MQDKVQSLKQHIAPQIDCTALNKASMGNTKTHLFTLSCKRINNGQ